MSIEHAILGFLSRAPMTGYDLKKRFADSDILYWSGNSNQIYKALVELRQAGLVSQAVEQPPSGPARKVYSLTEAGLAELRAWLRQTPEPPQVRAPFLVQLLWADQLEPGELASLLARYEEELRVKLLMLRAQADRAQGAQASGARAAQVQALVAQRWQSFFENELAWIQTVREQLLGAEGA